MPIPLPRIYSHTYSTNTTRPKRNLPIPKKYWGFFKKVFEFPKGVVIDENGVVQPLLKQSKKYPSFPFDGNLEDEEEEEDSDEEFSPKESSESEQSSSSSSDDQPEEDSETEDVSSEEEEEGSKKKKKRKHFIEQLVEEPQKHLKLDNIEEQTINEMSNIENKKEHEINEEQVKEEVNKEEHAKEEQVKEEHANEEQVNKKEQEQEDVKKEE